MSNVSYPFIPPGKTFKFAAPDDPFMQAAKEAQETKSGDQFFPVGVAIVKDGRILVTAGNGFNKGSEFVHICPRVVLECKSGEGYDLCHHHDAPGHAEQQAVKAAKEQGIDLAGADCYMYGHWWACEPCWNVLLEAGIRDVYLLKNAAEEFSREKVYTKTLVPSVKTAYLSGGLTRTPKEIRAFYDVLKIACAEVGVALYCPHEHSDPRAGMENLSSADIYKLNKKCVLEREIVIASVGEPSLGTGVELEIASAAGKPIVLLSEANSCISRMARGVPSVVYHVEYTDVEDAKRKLKNVLKQL